MLKTISLALISVFLFGACASVSMQDCPEPNQVYMLDRFKGCPLVEAKRERVCLSNEEIEKLPAFDRFKEKIKCTLN
jgi:hypothetical protein